MFGFGRRKKNAAQFGISDPSEAVNNVIFITADSNPFFSISTSLFKGDLTYLDTIVSMFGNMVDEELRDDMNKLYDRLTNIEHQTAIRAATVVIHPDIKEGIRLARAIEDIPATFHLKVFGIIVSNGRVWHDLVLGTSGEVNRESITNFQLAALVDEGNVEPFI